METRKLQEVGGGTFTVSIPKEWAQEHGLDAGATIHLYRHLDDSIVVRGTPRDGDVLSTIQVELTDDSTTGVARLVHAGNDVGAQELTLWSEEAVEDDSRRAIRAAVRDVAGATIRGEERDAIRVHFALDPSEVSISQSLDQLRFVALSVHRQGTTALVTGDGDCLDRIREHEAEARRVRDILTRLCNRSLVSFQEIDRLGQTRPAVFEAYQTAMHVYGVAEAGTRIARVVAGHPRSLPDGAAESVRSIADESRQAVTDGVATVTEDGDAREARTVRDAASAVAEDVATLRRRHCHDPASSLDSRATAVELARALDQLEVTVDHASAIADVGLRSRLRPLET
jgi:phosphate uptake regulator